MLAKSFGVTRLVMIINKMEDPSVQWRQERFEQIRRKMIPYFTNACRFNVETEVIWVPISGINGDYIMQNVAREKAEWYNGPCLIEVLDSLPLPQRNSEDALRIPIIDRSKDQGLTVYGKIENGMVVKGLRVIVMPIKAKAEVTEIMRRRRYQNDL